MAFYQRSSLLQISQLIVKHVFLRKKKVVVLHLECPDTYFINELNI